MVGHNLRIGKGVVVKLKKQTKSIDRQFLFITLLLAALGLIAVADASAPQALSTFNDKYFFVKQQAMWGASGLALMFIVSKVHYSFWQKIATPLFFFSILLLIVVLIPSLGTKVFGARRWIIAGSISIQPSEIAKLGLAIYLAKVASLNKKVLSFFLPIGAVTALVMLQPDLGTTMVIAAFGIIQVFVSGIPIVGIILALIVGGLSSLALILTSDYRRDRLLTFLKISADPLGRDYHIRQVLLALGSGGIFGVGLGQSRQKYLFLPEAATDSIFAVIAEEFGFIGGVALVCLFAFFCIKGLRIAKSAPDKFSQVLGIGLVSWISVQVILNIGSMVALVPLTGIPLPFFSYGGSALTTILIAAGILLNISRFNHAK